MMTEAEQQPAAQIYSTSVKIEQTAKGLAMVTVHIYSNSDEDASARAVNLYIETLKSLAQKGQTTASQASEVK